MVTSQVLISCRQHSRDKWALNEKSVFLYAESADFPCPGIAPEAKVKLSLKAHAVPWDGNQTGMLRKNPN